MRDRCMSAPRGTSGTSVTLDDVLTKWRHLAEEWRALGASVSGEKVAEAIVADLTALDAGQAERLLSPTDAARVSGYHPESIARLVRTGKLTNYGTPHRPRVKLAELPRKAPSTRPRKRRSVANPITADASCEKTTDNNRSTTPSTNDIARNAVAGRIGRA